jgi:nucleotide-binding universal stress UspA family protein
MNTIAPATITHLLVPLDGSRLAEAALPAATALAEHLGARVTLLHVMERHAPATVHGERHLTRAGEADAYLNGVASRFADAGVPVEGHVHPNEEGDVAASVAEHAAEFGADLVVLCTHGRGGPREWLFGSLAQQVVRRAIAPVLLVRPGPDGNAPPFAPRAVLVALDGTAEGELALSAALALARALGATVRLVVVVATLATVAGDRAATARLSPAATTAALDLEQEAAQGYLERLRGSLIHQGQSLTDQGPAQPQAAGVPIEVQVGRGDAVQVVTELATRATGDLLAVATHGHAGFDALWSGSVGSKVVARFGGPLLLVPARRE